jgi:hypothetical protein
LQSVWPTVTTAAITLDGWVLACQGPLGHRALKKCNELRLNPVQPLVRQRGIRRSQMINMLREMRPYRFSGRPPAEALTLHRNGVRPARWASHSLARNGLM